jgi:hypothetical protein
MIFCLTVIPEASIEALKAQLAAAKGTAFFFPVYLLFFLSYQYNFVNIFFFGFQRRRTSLSSSIRKS